MTRQKRIEHIIYETFHPIYFVLNNESAQHAKHNQFESEETHFHLFIVSSVFDHLSRLERQRLVMEVLKKEFETGLHALSFKLLSYREWLQEGHFSSLQLLDHLENKKS